MIDSDAEVILANKGEMAAWLGLSPRGLDKHEALWVRVGAKFDVKATTIAYCEHLRDVASGRGGKEQALILSEQRARLAKEQADEKEIKNAALRRELLPAAEVEATWGDFLRDLRSRFLALPARVQVAAGLTQAQKLAVDREVRATLTQVATDADD